MPMWFAVCTCLAPERLLRNVTAASHTLQVDAVVLTCWLCRWIRSKSLVARTRVLQLVTEEIESLSDAIVTSPEFKLEAALRGPMHQRTHRNNRARSLSLRSSQTLSMADSEPGSGAGKAWYGAASFSAPVTPET
jgi:hypothetical protein